MRYFIELAYKGTGFNGWQRQPNAPTVQQEIERALSLYLRMPVTINGSSRTDTGVHATQQYAHFETPHRIDFEPRMYYRLNGILDKDVVIRKIIPVHYNSHSRFDAIARKYTYRISTRKDPFNRGLSSEYYGKLDLDKMNEASEVLLKHTDFQCFSKVKTDVTSFLCTIQYAWWESKDGLVMFHIKSNRFLRGMVRAIVGTLMEVGSGKLSIKEFEDIILSKNRQKAGKSAPAEGLTLEEVEYPAGYFEDMNITKVLKYDIITAEEAHMPVVRQLFETYAENLGVDLCFQGFTEEMETLPGKYADPEGTILLAQTAEGFAGVVALKKIGEGICEMKRLFVGENFKGYGLGKALTLKLIEVAREKGYRQMNLDTLERLGPAVNLYRNLGFNETEPYNFNPEEDILYFSLAL